MANSVLQLIRTPTQSRLRTYILAAVLAYTNQGRLVVNEADILAALPACQMRWLKLRLRLALKALVRNQLLMTNNNGYYITTFGRRVMRDALNREPWLATPNAPCGN